MILTTAAAVAAVGAAVAAVTVVAGVAANSSNDNSGMTMTSNVNERKSKSAMTTPKQVMYVSICSEMLTSEAHE